MFKCTFMSSQRGNTGLIHTGKREISIDIYTEISIDTYTEISRYLKLYGISRYLQGVIFVGHR